METSELEESFLGPVWAAMQVLEKAGAVRLNFERQKKTPLWEPLAKDRALG